jgi:hypothetical protein
MQVEVLLRILAIEAGRFLRASISKSVDITSGMKKTIPREIFLTEVFLEAYSDDHCSSYFGLAIS